ncbi:uncharacterized protein LOC121235514 [Juglans microcarpa x Juglans regia]|uniref:uncharacterized protein LOC121235514 n=1 Tax=Juglans microcarpa x Juglans regia TaxID=2249226 RepID=UPI001B7E504B|nr:uncharacterized protein LOC121235514 [Juglans microcarpa x Juglans regia]
MSAGLEKCSKIRHIVRLRQMLRRWTWRTSNEQTRTPWQNTVGIRSKLDFWAESRPLLHGLTEKSIW